MFNIWLISIIPAKMTFCIILYKILNNIGIEMLQCAQRVTWDLVLIIIYLLFLKWLKQEWKNTTPLFTRQCIVLAHICVYVCVCNRALGLGAHAWALLWCCHCCLWVAQCGQWWQCRGAVRQPRHGIQAASAGRQGQECSLVVCRAAPSR